MRVLEEHALDRRLAGRAHAHLGLDDGAVGQLGAQVGVVEGDGKDAAAELQQARCLLDRDEERPLLLRERREKQVAERHAVQVLALVGLEAVVEEALSKRPLNSTEPVN